MIQDDAIADLRQATHILSTIPPSGEPSCDSVLQHHGVDIRKAALSGHLQWIGYLSSTGN